MERLSTGRNTLATSNIESDSYYGIRVSVEAPRFQRCWTTPHATKLYPSLVDRSIWLQITNLPAGQ
jgi:hypothetical protein